MRLKTEPYLEQCQRWPARGRHILAQFDNESVVVYQAYLPKIGHFAAQRGYFGGAFSLDRMSWIKPNFLWMMYRSGWGTKQGQKVTLAVWLRRSAFDEVRGRSSSACAARCWPATPGSGSSTSKTSPLSWASSAGTPGLLPMGSYWSPGRKCTLSGSSPSPSGSGWTRPGERRAARGPRQYGNGKAAERPGPLWGGEGTWTWILGYARW